MLKKSVIKSKRQAKQVAKQQRNQARIIKARQKGLKTAVKLKSQRKKKNLNMIMKSNVY